MAFFESVQEMSDTCSKQSAKVIYFNYRHMKRGVGYMSDECP